MIYQFGDCELDERHAVLRRSGQVVPVEPQVYDVLRCLVEGGGEMVTKEDLLDTVWGSRFVSESALTSRIKSARRAVGDDGARQEVIRTVHGRGYRLVAPVEVRTEPVGTSGEVPASTPAADQAALPLAPHELIGREALLDSLAEDLASTRLLTLVGPAGVGKTSVGLELARRVGTSRPDGVVLVELVGVGGSDAEATSAAIAAALDVNVRHQTSIEVAILDMVATRDMLLVLDNCEHVIEAVAGLAEKILRVAPRVTVVATSREPLAVAGEHVRLIEPLDVHGLDALSPAELGEVPAVALFTARARAIDARFELDEATAGSVVEIVRRLDGIPLALELAASRVHAIDVVEIAQRLDERLRLLRAVRRGADPRHAALTDAISWSYDLLEPDEQRMFTKLAVFAGPFDLDDAESVCEDEDDVIDLLSRLSQRSMVAVRRPASGGTRYEMLETLREFGLERLDDLANVALFQAHARHFVGTAAEIAGALQGREEEAGMQRGDRSFADLRAAQRFAGGTDDVDSAYELVTNLGEYAMRSMRYEVFGWADALADTHGAVEHPLRPQVTALRGYASFVRGEFDDALRLADLADEQRRALGAAQLALIERVRVNALYILGRNDDGGAAGAAMIEAADASGNPSQQAHANYMASIGASSADEVELATERSLAAFAAARRSGSPTDLASAWTAKGFAIRGDDEAALDAFAAGNRIAKSVGNRWMSAFAATEASALRVMRGDVAAGCRGLAETVDIWYRAGEWSQQWLTLSRCIVALDRIDQRELAAEVLGAVERYATLLATPIIPSVRDVTVDTSESLRAALGDDRFDDRRAAGVHVSLPTLVDRTRRTLLGLAD